MANLCIHKLATTAPVNIILSYVTIAKQDCYFETLLSAVHLSYNWEIWYNKMYFLLVVILDTLSHVMCTATCSVRDAHKICIDKG